VKSLWRRPVCTLLLLWVAVWPCTAVAEHLETVRVQLKWKHQFQFAGLYMALEKGFYRQEGLNVQLLEGGPGLAPVDMLLAGKAEYSIADSGVLLYRGEGKPLIVLASIFQHSPQVIYTRDDIATPADLKGRRVMMQKGYMTVEVQTLLNHYGVRAGDFERQPIGSIDDLIAGKTDAFPGYSSNEEFLLAQRGIAYRMFRPRDIGIDFYGDVLVTTERELAFHAARAEAFRRATLKGWSYALDHIDEAVALILDRYNTQHKSREYLRFEGKSIRSLMVPDVVPIGLSNRHRWQHIAEAFAASGFSVPGIDWDRFLYYPSTSLRQVLYEYRAIVTIIAVFGFALLLAVYSILLRRQVRSRTQQLQEASVEFERILDRMQDVYYRADAAGKVQWISATVKEKMGYAREELIGVPLSQLYADKDGRLRFLQALDANGGRVDNYKMRLRCKDGSILWAEASSQYIVDGRGQVIGIEGNVRDVAQRYLAEEAARKARAELEVIFDNMQDTFYRADTEGIIVFASPSVSSLLGVSVGEIVGTNLDEWYADSDGRKMFLDALRLGGGSVSNFETRLRHKDGHVFWVSASSHYCYDDDGEIIGVEGVVRDISDIKKAEQEKEELTAQFQQAQKMESIGLLAGGIAHDFNNLLVGVMGSAELAMMDLQRPQEMQAHLQQIMQSAQKGSQLVRQLLAYAGRGKVAVECVEINALLENMASLMRTVISKQARLQCELSKEPCFVMGDASQLGQIVMNLIANASDALLGQPGTVRLRTGKTLLEREDIQQMPPYDGGEVRAGEYVFFEVADDGCGIAPEIRDHLFDPFFTTKSEGTGLGLSALMGIVKQHGGRIQLQSEPGEGSSFCVYLPRAQEMARISRSRPDDEADTVVEAPPLSGTVLIVDDEAAVRRVASGMLEHAGMRVLLAEDGKHALALLDKHPDEIDLVILDISMPGMRGEEVFAIMRQRKPALPIIISSGHPRTEAATALGLEHRVGFVYKPYHYKNLIHMVAMLLQ